MNNFLKYTTWAVAAAASLTLASCDDVFEPAIENQLDINTVFSRPESAWTFLGNAYILLPFQQMPQSDLATDDCVSNDEGNGWRKMGADWRSDNDPTTQWQGRFGAIQYINIFLEHVDDVKFALSDEVRNQMFADHAKGEAYGMRALNYYHLLRAHTGPVGGKLLGVPIHEASEDGASDFNQARPELRACIDFVLSDIEKCLSYLPDENGDVKDVNANPFIKKYAAMYGNDTESALFSYNQAFGNAQIGKMCGRYAKAVRAQLMLWAASPAYADASGVTWEEAAKYCAEVIGDKKMDGIDPMGHNWFTNYSWLTALGNGQMTDEFIWRSGKGQSSDRESDNFPKSAYGNGRVNPTQNLVDAFPMANGYPITDERSGYDAKNPYAGRDPRLADAVLVNGEKFGEITICTGTYDTKTDGIDIKAGESTRTGYFLKKFLRSDVNLGEPKTEQYHTWAYIRMTEFYLGYAEAANEAWGPTGSGSYGMSAVDVLRAIRTRAGVATDYINEVAAAGKDAMREFIHNERRLELCFENHRLFDLRRWKDLAHMTEMPRAIEFTSETEYTIRDVRNEVRNYKDYMFYGPIPKSECMKFSNLQQNDGWN